MNSLFPRSLLARDLTRRLLKPGVLDEALRSGLFLTGTHGIGKTTFLRNDLVPALRQEGAIVVCADVAFDSPFAPDVQVRNVIWDALGETAYSNLVVPQIQTSRASLAAVQNGERQRSPVEIRASDTMAGSFTSLIDKTRTDVVLIIDEIQRLLDSEANTALLRALKATRDAVNLRDKTPGHFLLIGCGADFAQICRMVGDSEHPFEGATVSTFPVLGAEYIAHMLGQLHENELKPLPSIQGALAAFQALGNRPAVFNSLLVQLQSSSFAVGDPDTTLMGMAQSHSDRTDQQAWPSIFI